ncbi:membrane-binding protein [uncultured Acinetobacter sp.]|uniref:membrane-binding protein n=2 Tax=Acinetobacter TaxID=469 RepID=UPI00258349EE|nr:membrane-binding protein [uncultured Acinetobacter sp.]
MKIIPVLLSTCLISISMIGCSQLSTTSSTTNLSKTLATNEAIIAYFAPDAGDEECSCGSSVMDQGYSLQPVENGYFRKLLGRDKDGRFLVQDFYQNSHKKQSDPFWIKEPQGLNSFDGKYIDGNVTGYYENGTINFKASYKDLQPIGKAENFYPNKQLGLEESYIDDQTIIQKFGIKMAKSQPNSKLTQVKIIPLLRAGFGINKVNLLMTKYNLKTFLRNYIYNSLPINNSKIYEIISPHSLRLGFRVE